MNRRGQEPDAASAGKLPAGAKWIVIADDDDVVRALWSDVLRRAGYRTLEARTGQAALDIMRAIVPDLLILDLRMPDLSGDDVPRHFRTSGVLRFMPVLVISGFLEQEPHDRQGLNVVGSLPKPLSAADLLSSVSAALAPRSEQWPEVKSGPAIGS